MKRHTVLAMTWLLTTPALAVNASAADIYLFADAGLAEPDMDTLDRRHQRMAESITDNGGVALRDVDDQSGAGTIGVGIQPFRYLALELAYYHLGSYQFETRGALTAPSQQLSSRTVTDVKARGWGLNGKLLLPITEALNGTFTAGVARIDTDITAVTTRSGEVLGEPMSSRDTVEHHFEDTVGILGIGAWYQFGAHLGLRLDYRYLGGFGQSDNGSDSDLDLFTAGVTYTF
ncbi:outer membrane beta-barrel protein [Halomonas sp. EGI 63088]|uniref:Outer membrane beta-barrel protein n=1 Tax=Halomonas flagellata TaxID=2920385 RepID=A0ABS9RXU6_9GAMM|nr:outer membrane beta-barrel protein [Halomonas flagellata]MCH4564687.1 outer membrane beta-barrel protein [Halomonas flagellata]